MAKRTKTKPKRAKKKPAVEKRKWLTRRELASVMGVHPMTITKWEQEGMPIEQRGSKGRPSHYNELGVRAWKQMRDEAAAKPGAVDLISERARKERAQAALAEQALQIRNRELLPREEVEKAWSAEVAAVRAKLLALPTTLADTLHRAAVTEGVPGVERALESAVHDALRELSTPLASSAPPAPAA